MTNTSKEAIERLAIVFDKKASKHDGGTLAYSFDTVTADTIRALAAERDELQDKLDVLGKYWNEGGYWTGVSHGDVSVIGAALAKHKEK